MDQRGAAENTDLEYLQRIKNYEKSKQQHIYEQIDATIEIATALSIPEYYIQNSICFFLAGKKNLLLEPDDVILSSASIALSLGFLDSRSKLENILVHSKEIYDVPIHTDYYPMYIEEIIKTALDICISLDFDLPLLEDYTDFQRLVDPSLFTSEETIQQWQLGDIIDRCHILRNDVFRTTIPMFFTDSEINTAIIFIEYIDENTIPDIAHDSKRTTATIDDFFSYLSSKNIPHTSRLIKYLTCEILSLYQDLQK